MCYFIAIQAPDRGQVCPQGSTMKPEPNMLKIKPYQKRKSNSANGNPAISLGFPMQEPKVRTNLDTHTGLLTGHESPHGLQKLNTGQIKPGFLIKANNTSRLKVFQARKCYLQQNKPVQRSTL